MHIVHSIFKKSRGGAERAFIDYCRMSLDQGHQVSAIVHPKCKMIPDLEALNIPYKTIGFIGGWDPIARFKAKRALKDFQPQMIVSHGSRPAQLLHGLMPDVPLLGVAHVYKNVDFFVPRQIPMITLTRDMQTYAKDQGVPAEKLFRLSNVVYLDQYSPHNYAVRKPYRIGSMGRFAHSKGFDVLIEALGMLHNNGHDFRCDIAGTGHRKSELQRQIQRLGMSQKVTLHDWIDHVGDFLDGLDLFVFPSRHEPFGLALLEAMARGLPIVSADAEGPREIITSEVNGLLCHKGDAKDMAEAIENMMEDPQMAKQLGEAARKTFEEKFHPGVISRELDSIYSTLVGSAAAQ